MRYREQLHGDGAGVQWQGDAIVPEMRDIQTRALPPLLRLQPVHTENGPPLPLVSVTTAPRYGEHAIHTSSRPKRADKKL